MHLKLTYIILGVFFLGLSRGENIQVDFSFLFQNGTSGEIFLSFDGGVEYSLGGTGFWEEYSKNFKTASIMIDFNDVPEDPQSIHLRTDDIVEFGLYQFWMTIHRDENSKETYKSEFWWSVAIFMGTDLFGLELTSSEFALYEVPEGDVRFVDGPSQFEGRVEILHDNIWQSVCSSHFGATEANSVCAHRGYRFYTKMSADFNGNTRISLNCSGDKGLHECEVVSFEESDQCDFGNVYIQCDGCMDKPGYRTFEYANYGGECIYPYEGVVVTPSDTEAVDKCRQTCSDDEGCIAFSSYDTTIYDWGEAPSDCCYSSQSKPLIPWDGLCYYVSNDAWAECLPIAGYETFDNMGKSINIDEGGCLEYESAVECADACRNARDCEAFHFKIADKECCHWNKNDAYFMQFYYGVCTYMEIPLTPTYCPPIQGFVEEGDSSVRESTIDCVLNGGVESDPGSFFECKIACEENAQCMTFQYTENSGTCCQMRVRPDVTERDSCVYSVELEDDITVFDCNIEISGFTDTHLHRVNGLYFLDTDHIQGNRAVYRKVEDGLILFWDSGIFGASDDNGYWEIEYNYDDGGQRGSIARAHTGDSSRTKFYMTEDLTWFQRPLDADETHWITSDNTVQGIEVSCSNVTTVCQGFEDCCRLSGPCEEGKGFCDTHSHCKGDLLCGFDNCAWTGDASGTNCCTSEEKFVCPSLSGYDLHKNQGVPINKCEHEISNEFCDFKFEESDKLGASFTWFDGKCCFHSEIPVEEEMEKLVGQCTYTKIAAVEVKVDEEWYLTFSMIVTYTVMGIFFIFLVLFGVALCMERNAKASALLTVGSSLGDVLSDIAFCYEVWQLGLAVVAYISLGSLGLAVLVNSFLLVKTLRREYNNPEFREWFNEHAFIGSATIALSSTNINVFRLLHSKIVLFSKTAFSAPVTRQTENSMHYGLATTLCEDVPQFFLQLYTIVHLSHAGEYNPIVFVSTFFSFLGVVTKTIQYLLLFIFRQTQLAHAQQRTRENSNSSDELEMGIGRTRNSSRPIVPQAEVGMFDVPSGNY